ncbi:MAG: inositol phosphorylceramide synthase [Chloroflexi bacterium]|nr:MAG: inositol phosphorylceramide synthase [Chloroflexota bacterium]
MLLAASTFYLLVIFGVMLARGISIEPQWVVLALLLIAVAMGRGGQFIKDWAPFLVLFFAYEAMRGFAAKTGFAPHDLSGLERLLFAGNLPTMVLQQNFYDPHAVRPQDVVALVLYFMHFPLPIVVGFIFWTRSREHYWRFISALLLMSFLAFLTYLFYPSVPPRLQFPHQVHWVTDETVKKLFNNYYISPIYSHLNPNQFAAFPSLHAAFPLLAASYAWNRYRALSIGLAIWTAGVWTAIVYLGEHYFVDALAGLIYAAVAALLVEVGAGRFRPPRRA